MILDLISSNNSLIINIPTAHLIGLAGAAYLAELLNINDKACKKKLCSNDYFLVDRKYVESKTTLSREEQLALDKKLVKLNIISKDSENAERIHIDTTQIVALITTEDASILKTVSKIVSSGSKGPSKMSQRQATMENLKQFVTYQNEELRQACKDWIEGVYARPTGFLSKKAIQVFQQTVDQYANGDLDLALKIVEIATINGYRDATWAINLFKKDYESTFRRTYGIVSTGEPVTKKQVNLGEEVF